ncbi:MAG: hypothetical protein QOF96_1880 [Actinomycetota bacterium]|jgi:hypothetical protein|nr:hypothetical protein [Actinomycetota bacterium]
MLARHSDRPHPAGASLPPPPTTSVAPTPARRATIPVEAVMIFGGIAAALAGLLLPWVTVIAPFVGPISRTGLDTADGRTIGMLLLALGLVALWEHRSPGLWPRIGLVAGLAAVAALVYVDQQDTVRRLGDLGSGLGTGSVGTGVYFCGFGTLIATVAMLQRIATMRSRRLASKLPPERLAARRALMGKAGRALFGLTLFTVTLVGGTR